MRNVLAVASGYLLFAGSAVLLFQVSGVDPHGASSLRFRVLSILYGAGFALVSGVLARRMAQRDAKAPPMVVAGLIALAALVSTVASPGDHAIWTQVASIVLFAPLAAIGGRLARRSGTPQSR